MLYFIKIISWTLFSSIGYGVGTFGFLIRNRHRIIKKNLKIAFPNLSNKNLNHYRRVIWHHMGEFYLQNVFTIFFSNDTIPHLTLQKSAKQYFQEIKSINPSFIIMGAHLAHYILYGRISIVRDYPFYYLRRAFRGSTIINFLEKKFVKNSNYTREKVYEIDRRDSKDLKLIIQFFREKKTSHFLQIFDQRHPFNPNYKVLFFNRWISYHYPLFLRIIQYKKPFLFVYIVRKSFLKYEVHATAPVIIKNKEDLQNVVQQLFTQLEQVIRQYPYNWWWAHNLFKDSKDKDDYPSL